MAPITQKALLIKEAKGLFVVDQIPVEKPGEGQVLIKVQSAALNPVDWKIQKWDVLIDGYPCVLGSDIAGDVEEVGEGVTDFKRGDRVFCQSEFLKRRGAFQQYVVSFVDTVARIPTRLTYDDVSTLPMGLSTAYSALYSYPPTGLGITSIGGNGIGKYSGHAIVILGGSTSVAQYAIQLAKLSGFSQIITTASSRHADALRALGATHVLDRSLTIEQIKADIAKAISAPVALAFDTVSGATTQQLALDVVMANGIVAFVLPSSVTPTDGKKIVQAFAGLRNDHNLELLKTLYHDRIHDWLDQGLIIPNRFEILPNGLHGVQAGMDRLEANQVSRLKLVSRPQETV